MPNRSSTFFRRNGLSLVLLFIMLLAWGGQALTGWCEKNNELQEHGDHVLTFGAYLGSHHFWSATGENWESEFLQMGLYVLLTIRLRQLGSSESKQLEGKEEVDRTPRSRPDAPWPVRKGGWYLKVYQHSLSIAFIVLFLLSFLVHLNNSCAEYNAERVEKGRTVVTTAGFLGSSRFWFESFQNWQSEFLAVLSIVFLSIHLRQKGSPESKPVDASHEHTGTS
ncbi:MAG: DUF6766 family protein [Flavobacteriales bacterium]